MRKNPAALLLLVSALCFVFAAGGGVFGAAFGLPMSYGLAMASMLCEVSAALFAVYGIWLGLSYRDDLGRVLDGKEGDDLRRSAKSVVATVERCKVLFRGLAVSTVVFLASLVIQVSVPVLQAAIHTFRFAALLKGFFFFVVLAGVAAQAFSILATVAVMVDAYQRACAAGDDAERTLRRLPPSKR